MAFMELQSEQGKWYLVETRQGTDIIPADVCGDLGIEVGQTIDRDDDNVTAADWREMVMKVRDYVGVTHSPMQDIQSIECVECWGARYSAPGYMDATDWVLGDTQAEAEKDCREMYGDDEPEDETDEPAEDDYTTTDHRKVYQSGKLVLEVDEGECFEQKVKEHADREQFWPDCWFISDHGNAHRIDYTTSKE